MNVRERCRKDLVDLGWLTDEVPILERLAFPLREDTRFINNFNVEIRDKVLKDILQGVAHPRDNSCFLGDGEDIVVAEVDRYGLPCRTVLNTTTGLFRSNPYYESDYLETFYAEVYRDLYALHPYPYAKYFSSGFSSGEIAYELSKTFLRRDAKILDIGCGAGASLLPFKMRGFETYGFDYGKEFIQLGQKLGLNVFEDSIWDHSIENIFDLIILSHVLEHVTDLERFLERVLYLLADDGHIYIEVPGIYNIEVAYQGDILNYLQNAHVWHFSQNTLVQTLGKCGLRVVSANQTINCLAARADDEPLSCLDENESRNIDWLLDLEKKLNMGAETCLGKLKKVLGLGKNYFYRKR